MKFSIDLISENDFNNENIKSTIQIMKANYETSLDRFSNKDINDDDQK
ncbi:hypothetical protein [Companilactobacillus metriopterae]|nr:hypothetical protein [Companilactobacillus metriopterae]